MEKLDNNQIEKAIATISHNLECLEEAEQIEKHKYGKQIEGINKERRRLQKLLSFYLSLTQER